MFLVMLALTLILAGNKLSGSLDWSWWFITAPVWGFALAFLLVVIETRFWSKRLKKIKDAQARAELAKSL